MLCVTIARTRHKHVITEHRQVAESGAKLVELRLDYIGRSIDLSRLLNNRPTPVVLTCRRKEDGGRWDRTEEERLMLLRTAISMGVEYVRNPRPHTPAGGCADRGRDLRGLPAFGRASEEPAPGSR